MEQKVFEITYIEGDVSNKKIKIEADTPVHALQLFILDHPNTDYTHIEEVGDAECQV